MSTLEKEVLGELPKAKLSRFIEMRYEGQSYEIRVPFNQNSEKAFHKAHRKRYGYVRDTKVETVTAVVRGRVPGPRCKLPPLGVTRKKWKAGRYLRENFGAGDTIPGPSVISEDNATTYVPKGWKVKVESNGLMRICR